MTPEGFPPDPMRNSTRLEGALSAGRTAQLLSVAFCPVSAAPVSTGRNVKHDASGTRNGKSPPSEHGVIALASMGSPDDEDAPPSRPESPPDDVPLVPELDAPLVPELDAPASTSIPRRGSASSSPHAATTAAPSTNPPIARRTVSMPFTMHAARLEAWGLLGPSRSPVAHSRS